MLLQSSHFKGHLGSSNQIMSALLVARLVVLAIVAAIILGAPMHGHAAADQGGAILNPGADDTSVRIIQGIVVRMVGNSYVVKDPAGQEVRIFVDQNSRVEDAFEVGDTIEVHVSDKRWAKFIRRIPK